MGQSSKQSLSESQVGCGIRPATGENLCRTKVEWKKICATRWHGKDWKWMGLFELDRVTQVPAYSKGPGAPWRTQVLNLLLPTFFWGLLHVNCHHDITVEPSLRPSVQFRWSVTICRCCERNEPCTSSWLLLTELSPSPASCLYVSRLPQTAHGYWRIQ